MIAGFVIGSKGWRWFLMVCAILGAVNFLASVLFLPETTFRHHLTEVGNVHAADFEKEAKQKTEHRENESSPRSYWKDLISIRDRGLEPEGLKCWPGQFSLPFRFICVPIVLFATVAYGIFLSGLVDLYCCSYCLLFLLSFLGAAFCPTYYTNDLYSSSSSYY